MFSNILVKIKSQHWRIIYYVEHFIGFLCALGFIAVSYLTHEAELETVHEFDLDLTSNVSIIFYVASGQLIATVFIGCLAQCLSDRPSLWIVYCIGRVILFMIILTGSVTATSKSKTQNFPVGRMKSTMENYDLNTTSAIQWDKLQENYECCGTEGYKDWQDVHFGRTSLRVPISCCLPEKRNNELCGLNILPHDDMAHEKIYTKGCLQPALQRVQTMLTILSIMGLAYSAASFATGTIACFLVITKRI